MKRAIILAIIIGFGISVLNGQSWIASNKISCTQSFTELASGLNSNGEVLTYGYFEGTLSSSGGKSITSYGGRDYYLIKFLGDGSVDWMKNYGSTLSDYVFGGMSIDNNDNILLTGGFMGYFKYTASDSIESSGMFDIFLLGLDPLGDVSWARIPGQGASFQLPTTLGTDETGSAILAGLFIDSINFYNDLSLYADKSYADYFYGSFDITNGDINWTEQVRAINNSNSKINDIYCDVNNYYYTGIFSDSVGFEDDTIVATNSMNDVHLFSSDSNGLISWIRKIQGAGDEFSYSVLLDDENNVYVSGYYNSDTLFIDSTENESIIVVGNEGSFDLFVARFSSAGTLDWIKTAGSKAEDKTFNMEFFDDKVWITGYFADTLNWGGIQLVTEGPSDNDMFTGSIDKNGNFRDANQYSGRNNSDDQGRGLFKSGDNLYTLMKTNSDLISIGDSIYTSDGVSYYMILGIIGCLPINVEANEVNAIDCFGDSTGSILIEPTGGFAGTWQYSVDNGDNYSTGGFIQDLPAGDYQVVVIDGEGCSEVGPLISLIDPDTLLAIVDYKQDILVDTAWNGIVEISDGLLSIIASGGNGGYTYQLLPDGDTLGIGYYEFAYEDSGKYVVAVNDSKNCGPSNSDTIEINVIYSSALGVGDFGAAEVKIYPNPTSGIVTVEMPYEGKRTKLEVISMTGQTVLKRKVFPNGGVITETIDLSDQAKGLYMVRINGQSLPSAVVVK